MPAGLGVGFVRLAWVDRAQPSPESYVCYGLASQALGVVTPVVGD